MSLISDFEDRKSEIKSYIILLEQIENALAAGRPLLSAGDGKSSYKISPAQQKILYSCLYLQLYNLIELTVTKCISNIEQNIQMLDASSWNLLSSNIRKELLRAIAKRHASSSVDTRTNAMFDFLDSMFLPNSKIDASIDKGEGGNWDDEDIFNLARRIGVQLIIPPELNADVKKNQYDDKKGLELVKHFRNKLAHGELSFVDCGERLSFIELQKLSEVVFAYLEAIIRCFENFVIEKSYMQETNKTAALQ